MKELDFLPQWYRNDQKRRAGYKWQYIVIGTVFAVMVGWSFVTGSVIHTTKAGIGDSKEYTSIIAKYRALDEKHKSLLEGQEILTNCDARMQVSSIMAELSWLIDNSIVLKGLEIKSEDSSNVMRQLMPMAGGSVVRRNIGNKDNKDSKTLYKLVISGIAAEAEDVAKLIHNMEESNYFCNIIPGYSRNVEINEKKVSEFEISCYVANYKEESF